MSPDSQQKNGGKHTPPPPLLRTTPTPSTSVPNPSMLLANPPALITWRNLKLLVMDAPSESNLAVYLGEMQKHNVVALVRVCEPTYSKAAVEALGITLYDWVFPDGEGPPDSVIDAWLDLVANTFPKSTSTEDATLSHDLHNAPSIACHCVAGLGRYVAIFN